MIEINKLHIVYILYNYILTIGDLQILQKIRFLHIVTIFEFYILKNLVKQYLCHILFTYPSETITLW